MRNLFKTMLVVLAVSPVFMSCENKENEKFEPKYYMSVATVTENEKGDIFLTKDDGGTIFASNINFENYDSVVGKRAWFEHRLYKEAYKKPGFDETSQLFNFYPTVWTDTIYEIKSEAADNELRNDLITIQYGWVSGKYLNIGYEFWGTSVKNHEFKMARKMYGDHTNSDKIKLQFRHTDKEELHTKTFFTVSSFDIEEYLPAAGEETTLEISFRYSSIHPAHTFEIKLKGNEEAGDGSSNVIKLSKRLGK